MDTSVPNLTRTEDVPKFPYYQYEGLDHDARETRLAELLPGGFDDDIHIRIHHVALNSLDGASLQHDRFSSEELQRDLPKDWRVRETVNGRFIFERVKDYGPNEQYETSYIHPKAKFEPVANNYNLTHTKPEYEALSHVWGPQQNTTTAYVQPLAVSPRVARPSAKDDYYEQRKAVVTSAGIKRPTDDDFPLPPAKRGSGFRDLRAMAEASAAHVAAGVDDCTALHTSVSTLTISTDLASALRHLRYQKRSRMLWIDSICMNQQDVVEKSHLVQHMGQIYRLALRVIVWLGPEHSNSKLAMQNLHFLGLQVEITDRGSWRVNAPKCLHPTWSRTSVALPWERETWDTIIKLLKRPWFTRLWVWQEAKLANDDSIVQCGYDKMELYRFGAAAWCLAAKLSVVSADIQSTLFKAGDAVLRQFEPPFLNTLVHLNGKECFDPRDKIYGALGLAPQQIAAYIVPDYTKEVEEVYLDAAVALSNATDRVDFLMLCNIGERTFPGPTWAPDCEWDICIQSQNYLHTKAYTACARCRAGDYLPCRQESSDREGRSRDLRFRCSIVGPTRYCDRVYDGSTETMFDAFVKTLHWNILRERCPEDISFPTLAEARRAIAKTLQVTVNRSMITPLEADQIPGTTTARDHSIAALGRSFIELDNGLIGMTSTTGEETDIVSVILGCPLPIILRPHSSGRFQVVGPAYIHGRMDAERFLGPLGPSNVVQSGLAAGWYGGCTIRNLSTDEIFEEDPRLGEVPASWVRLRAVRMAVDPLHFVRFRHLGSGKTINGDPRLLPDALRARGVPVKPLKLV